MQSISSSNISENTSRDKEAFLIRTIHHWRSLNVSTVFYAWYKYSSRKKFLRQNHDYVVEKKQEFLMHSMFLQWNRSLYCKQASAEFAVSIFRKIDKICWQSDNTLWKKCYDIVLWCTPLFLVKFQFPNSIFCRMYIRIMRKFVVVKIFM